MTPRKFFRRLLVSMAICVVIVPAIAMATTDPADTHDDDADMSFLDGYTLVFVEDSDIPALHRARELIESRGGTIAIMSPPSILLGWVPMEIRDELVGRAGIKDIYYSEILPGELATRTEPEQSMISYFNAVVRGEIQAENDAFEEQAGAGALGSSLTAKQDRLPDLMVPPPLDTGSYLENLRSVGLDDKTLKERGLYPEGVSLSPAGNSDYMTGTIALSVFFIESDGSGTDPDLNTWTVEDMQKFMDAVATAMTWWSSRAASHAGCSATFLIYYYSGADPRCQQWTEPILHDTSYEDVWVKAIMSNFGYTSGTRWSRVTAFNSWQRATYQTARAYSAFIPYNPNGPPSFPDGHTAYAWYYGPYLVQLFHSGWVKAKVFAHESGHIFGACDEYAGGCSSCGHCTNGIDNGNCEACNPRSVDCVMKANDWVLCTYTPGQVGFGIVSPCTPTPPPPLPTPTVAVSYPSQLYQGLSGTITVGGSNFYAGAWVDFGPDVFVHKTTLVGAESLKVDVAVLNAAPLGFYDVTVRNRDFQEATLANGLEVLPTTRHYFSPTGGNVYPYLTPADAATTLEDAIFAGYEGDTLFVPTMTIVDFSLQIETGVLLHGGWNADFTARDLAGGKTVLHLVNNVLIYPTANKGGLDGFIVEYGQGSPIFTPFTGSVGGGVHILSGEATIANCEFHSNAASDGTVIGAGGAIFAEGTVVDIRDNHIHDNTATWGGAIYLYQSGGAVSGNTIESNTVSVSADTPYGAGVYLFDCDGVAFADNTFGGNSGAQDGGGILMENSTNVTIDGGTFTNNSSSFQGGGICVKHSEVGITGVAFDHNSAAIGAGVGVSDTSLVGVSGCRFLWNSGAIGGGVYAMTGAADVRHNLFVGNNTTGAGAAVYVSELTSGELAGNTLDRNVVGSGAGGMTINNTAIEVFNNIVTNSSGHGIAANGATLPWVGYNLVWGATGNDYDGTGPGDGAVTGDPAFADTASGDYHLGPHSPAIDAGRPGAVYEDPDGSRGDMGWYGSHAFTMDQPSYPKNLAVSLEFGDLVLRWSPNPEPDIDQYLIYCDSTSGFKPSADNFVAAVTSADTSANLGAPGDTSYYLVSTIDTDGYASGYSNEGYNGPPTEAGDVAYHQNRLYQNVPNPFNPTTRIRFELAERTQTTLVVYDVAGRVVKRLAGGERPRGVYSVTWDGTNDAGIRVSSGIYFYRLQAGSFVQTRKMLILK